MERFHEAERPDVKPSNFYLMSEELKPDAINAASDVAEETLQEVIDPAENVVEEPVTEPEAPAVEPEPEAAEEPAEEPEKTPGQILDETIAKVKDAVSDVKEGASNLAEKTLAELSSLFEKLSGADDRLRRSKEAESIKSAFYRRLSKDKAEAGYGPEVEEPSSRDDVIPEAELHTELPQSAPVSPFAAIEDGFKSLYNKYKKERAEYNKRLEGEREHNLELKEAVIEDLKALVDTQEELKDTFPKFRQIQARWREIGPVPMQSFRNLNDTYQFYVEKFYDKVQINRDLRDLDFKKNLEAKEEFCEQAEKLAESENVVESFKELQKLHEQWKEYGPVDKEHRDAIWDRFKAATAVINKKYQAYFEGMKSRQSDNLVAKTALCEKVEEIAGKEITTSNEWNRYSKEIEDIQKEWKKIGFASKKDNQKIYDRFRAACDKFFERKRDFYSKFKDDMNDNMARKMSLIEQAEALKDSTDWKKTTDQLINLQKQWKEIGAVPRKKSEQLWKRFRAACDAFFDERDKQAKPAENDFYANLKAKRKIIDDINVYESQGAEKDAEAMNEFASRWQAIGFVPFKEKENVNSQYKAAMQEKFPSYSSRGGRQSRNNSQPSRGPRTEKDRLVAQYNQLQQDIATYENNIGFFSSSRNSEPLIKQMQEKIDASKVELKELENRIRQLEAGEENAE